MSLRELLGEELYNQVIEKAGDNKIAIVSDGNWIPKDKFDAKINEVKDLQEQLNNRDEQLEELKKVDAEGLQAKIDELQQANEQTKTEYEANLKDLQLTSAIKLAINGKVHDEEVAATLIDKEKLVIGDDGEVIGLDKQIKSLQETKAYLFKTDGTPSNDPQIVASGNAQGGNPTRNPFTTEHWNLTEQGKLYKDNPELYKQMKAQAGK